LHAPVFPVDNALQTLGTRQVAADGIDASKEGTDWTADEVAVLVGSYFLMLAEERPAATTTSRSTAGA
jgi:hypothetical protein